MFGLHPKDLELGERALVTSHGTLLSSKYALAISPFLGYPNVKLPLDNSLSISFLVSQFPDKPANRFMILASITNGRSEEQLVIGQWQNSLVIMTGASYKDGGNEPRIIYDFTKTIEVSSSNSIEIHLTSTRNGTTLSIADEIVANDPYMELRLPEGQFRVTLGNSLDKSHGWPGELVRFKLESCILPLVFDSAATADGCSTRTNVIANYDFTYKKVESNIGDIDNSQLLLFPSVWRPQTISWLSTDSIFINSFASVLKDIVINIVGFFPIATIFYIVLLSFGNSFSRIAYCVLGCFALSLTIESIQIFIPSRTSSLADLVANTLGAFTAVFCVQLYNRYETSLHNNSSAQ